MTSVGIDTTSDHLSASGDTFDVNGVVVQAVSGAILAGLEGSPRGPFSSLGLSVNQTFGSVDGNAQRGRTTTPTRSRQRRSQEARSRRPMTEVWTHTLSTETSRSLPSVTTSPPTPELRVRWTQASLQLPVKITAINGTSSATIDGTIPSSDSQASIIIGYAGDFAYFDPAFSSGSAGAFTTAGTAGGTAGIGIISSTSFTFGPGLPIVGSLPFGGAPGVGAANCLVTGLDATSHPGPAQTGAATPGRPLELQLHGQGERRIVAQPGTSVLITPGASLRTWNLIQRVECARGELQHGSRCADHRDLAQLGRKCWIPGVELCIGRLATVRRSGYGHVERQRVQLHDH